MIFVITSAAYGATLDIEAVVSLARLEARLVELRAASQGLHDDVASFSALLAELRGDLNDRWRRAIPPGPVAAPRRPAVVVPAEPPRGAGWVAALRAFSGR